MQLAFSQKGLMKVWLRAFCHVHGWASQLAQCGGLKPHSLLNTHWASVKRLLRSGFVCLETCLRLLRHATHRIAAIVAGKANRICIIRKM